MSWYLDSNNKLTYDDLPETVDDLYSAPYPATFWRLDSNNILTLNSEDWSPFLEPIYDILTPPYPATMWYLNKNNKLMNALLPDELITGAFMDCIALKSVSIPKSVKSIGEYAFYGTALESVRISKDCTYYPTSFPPGCAINFYDTM